MGTLIFLTAAGAYADHGVIDPGRVAEDPVH
jgi:hypothetical protein